MWKVGRKVRGIKNSFLAWRYVINEEKKYNSNISIIQKLKCLFKGFSSEKYKLYNFEHKGLEEYLSDYKRFRTKEINGKYSIVLNDKHLFDRLSSSENVTPQLYGLIKDGVIYLDGEESSVDSLINLLKKKHYLIIKKQSGGGGKGIYKFHYKENKLGCNGQIITITEFSEKVKNFKNYIISEYLKQADYANEIYSETINTVRIITMRDPRTSEAFIPIAVHKFGSKKTGVADNVWRGGLTALVNIDTGIIQTPALHHDGNKKIDWVTKHPDTGVVIEGTQIPNWNEVKKSVISIADKFSFLDYVGWDVVVTTDGIKIIEGNNYSDVNFLQIHQPLLSDERVKEFYRHHGIIK